MLPGQLSQDDCARLFTIHPLIDKGGGGGADPAGIWRGIGRYGSRWHGGTGRRTASQVARSVTLDGVVPRRDGSAGRPKVNFDCIF
jgi:hypothetical protein